MNIIIPLGGKGERFRNEGYLLPKPLIKIFEKEIIFYVLDNLSLNKDDNIFIIYSQELTEYNFEEIILSKYPNVNLIGLNKQTKGAAETLFIGIKEIIHKHKYHKKCLIIDGDTFYTENIVDIYRNIKCNAVFYLKNYDDKPIFSYIKLNETNEIIDIKEKLKISDNANTGAYAFSDINELLHYSEYIVINNITFNNEPYTSCIIAEMLENNKKFIGYELNNDYVHILGTPKQVIDYSNKTHIFLFDLDGTLIISDDIYYDIWTDILNKYNIFLTKEIFETYIQGNSDINVIKSLMPNLDIDVNNISIIKDTLFNQKINRIKIIDGAINFIKKVKMYGNKIVIVTNCNRITAENIINYMEINNLIDGLIIGSECTRSKPFPDPYIKGCDLFNISTQSAFVFEDSKTGILSGRNINPKCLIGITTLYDDKTLKNLGVNLSIKNYTDNNLYQKIVEYEDDINKKIKEYIFNSYRKDIKDIIIFNEKIKGGYISDVIKVIIKLNDNTEHDCILKLENKNETKLSIMANNLGLYEREYYFYDNISKYVNIEIPEFYSIIKDNDFNNIGILMENINKIDFKLNLNLNVESIDISLKIIDSVAKLHSKFWGKNLQNTFKNLLKNNDSKFNPVWANYVNNNWESFKNRWQKLLNNKQLLISEKIVKNFQKIQDDLSDKNLTLCHGDIKSPNIFYKQIENNKYIPYFIDWQYISYGKGIQDIVFLMIESYDVDKMNLYFPIFKNYYYNKLLEYNVENYSYTEYEKDLINSICYYPFFVSIWFGTTPEEDLIDKNFPFFFIQKLFNFIEKYVPIDFIHTD